MAKKGEQKMTDNKIMIKCETEGFEEATEEVEALASAYDGFPPQVTVKQCRDCVINIYPSQTKIVEGGDDGNS